MKRILMAGVAAWMAAAVQAQIVTDGRGYAELGYSAISVEENALGHVIKSTPKAVRGVLGYQAYDNLALEVMAATGLGYSDGEATDPAAPGLKFKINSLYGWYVTPKAMLMDNLEGFVRLGYAHARGTATLPDGSSSDNENGFSYGLGMRYHFDRTTYLNVDYMAYLHKSEYKAKGMTLGVGFKF